MKLNLACGNDIRLGFKNIDINPTSKDVIKWDMRNLDGLVPDSSIDEIICIEGIGTLDCKELLSVIQGWFKKMSSGGELYIQSPDASLIGLIMEYEQASLEQINQLIYGTQNSKVTSIYNLTGLDTLLRNIGFRIKDKTYINNTHFIIRAVKP